MRNPREHVQRRGPNRTGVHRRRLTTLLKRSSAVSLMRDTLCYRNE